MTDALYDLLQPHLASSSQLPSSSPEISKYLSRLVSLRPSDLTTTEPQSLSQAAQSNLFSIQALSSRSHRTTTTSSDHLSSLRSSLPLISTSAELIKNAIPELDASAVNFASTYSKAKEESTSGGASGGGNALLTARRESSLLARQADKAQDILELPSLLSAAIASAHTTSAVSTTSASSGASGANYTQALDLFAHIKRLQILYPDSQLVKSVVADAESAMKDMTTNLVASLRGQNLRLAAAIRMIGWLRRVAPELSTSTTTGLGSATSQTSKPGLSTPTLTSQLGLGAPSSAHQEEGHFGALFLVSRLCTFLSMIEALSPLRDLADQETQARKEAASSRQTAHQQHPTSSSTTRAPPTGKPSSSGMGYNPSLAGQQTERYLKRFIEIFREQSFATISMYRNIFPADETFISTAPPEASSSSPSPDLSLSLTLPPALQTFPLHLIDIFISTLKQYLPNVTDPAARESLLMQVLYAANSLGRLGADFSLMIAELEEDEDDDEVDQGENPAEGTVADDITDVAEKDVEESESAEAHGSPVQATNGDGDGAGDLQARKAAATEAASETQTQTTTTKPHPQPEPEWISIIKKHRVQAARLEALAAGQEQRSRQ
ncbi:uncharacterized protein Z520_00325 [Fonsecaea multimorphosa CBS 102226]|uniref:Conserved oligomeric Golgi complex subunit 8 n=1 Tax=Fonsecaea multimorphosa CBS 102226 TaxID=1442371 RepID=A0A0D2L3L6_9EURO|nr:uncharacterized protein Z520_00325 [Fonsecaea multimorphosa CBS 102226]KIY03634.1 hypothetical protein Z520_00325 [Fonsecaea multimorphosa CBS 102226]OAL32334.1 hypothetical protein AYO22_00356 [Fonsecaea multimorphosa]